MSTKNSVTINFSPEVMAFIRHTADGYDITPEKFCKQAVNGLLWMIGNDGMAVAVPRQNTQGLDR